jgi:hypothetical protein
MTKQTQNVVVPEGFSVVRTRQELNWETLFNGEAHILSDYSATLESMLKNLKTTAKKRGVELMIATNPETGAIWLQAQLAQPEPQPVAKPKRKPSLPQRKRSK